jgi:hypothetical protein
VTYTRSWENTEPPERYDDVPWIGLRVFESETGATGTFVQRQDIPFAVLDDDPANPMSRDITTTMAVFDPGFYFFQYYDLAGTLFNGGIRYSGASAGAVVPTVEEIRFESKVVFAEYGYPEGDPDPLAPLLNEAVAEYQSVMSSHGIGLDLETLDPATPGGVLTRKALRMWVEYLAASSQPEIVDTAADFDLLSSWSAGPVSESRRNVSPNANMWHIWPALDRLLRGIGSLWIESQRPEGSTPDDVPALGLLDPLVPRPGKDVMDRRPATLSPFAAPVWWSVVVRRL